MKYLIALLVVVAVLLWLRANQRDRSRARSESPRAAPSADSPAARGAASGDGAAPMLRCALCGLHLPGSEALRLGEAAFCCEDHRSRHRAATSN